MFLDMSRCVICIGTFTVLNINFNFETISLAERRVSTQGCSNYTTNGRVAAGFCSN